MIGDIFEISFRAKPWKRPYTKVFEWKQDYWLSKEGAEMDDVTWQVTLLPCDTARVAPREVSQLTAQRAGLLLPILETEAVLIFGEVTLVTLGGGGGRLRY